MMEVLTLAIKEDLDVDNATFSTPNVTTFCRLDELGGPPPLLGPAGM